MPSCSRPVRLIRAHTVSHGRATRAGAWSAVGGLVWDRAEAWCSLCASRGLEQITSEARAASSMVVTGRIVDDVPLLCVARVQRNAAQRREPRVWDNLWAAPGAHSTRQRQPRSRSSARVCDPVARPPSAAESFVSILLLRKGMQMSCRPFPAPARDTYLGYLLMLVQYPAGPHTNPPTRICTRTHAQP